MENGEWRMESQYFCLAVARKRAWSLEFGGWSEFGEMKSVESSFPRNSRQNNDGESRARSKAGVGIGTGAGTEGGNCKKN